MRIHTLWRDWGSEELELLFALDDNTVVENFEAWVNGCQAAKERTGSTDANTRVVVIAVPFDAVSRAFMPPLVDARVEAADKDQRP